MAEKRLKIILDAVTAPFKKAIDFTVGKFKALRSQMADTWKESHASAARAAEDVAKVGHSAQGAGAVFKGMVSVEMLKQVSRALYEFGKAAVDMAADIGDGAAKIGASTDYFQRLSAAARDSGASMDKVSTVFAAVGANARLAADGDRKAIDAFAGIGVSIDDLRGKSPEQIFELAATAMSAMGDSSEAMAAKVAVAGSAVSDLNGQLGVLAASSGMDFGGIIDDSAVKAAQDLRKSFEGISNAMLAIAANSGFLNFLSGQADALKSFAGLFGDKPKGLHDRGKEYNQQLNASESKLDTAERYWINVGTLGIGYLPKLWGGRSLGQMATGYQKENQDIVTSGPEQLAAAAQASASRKKKDAVKAKVAEAAKGATEDRALGEIEDMLMTPVEKAYKALDAKLAQMRKGGVSEGIVSEYQSVREAQIEAMEAKASPAVAQPKATQSNASSVRLKAEVAATKGAIAEERRDYQELADSRAKIDARSTDAYLAELKKRADASRRQADAYGIKAPEGWKRLMDSPSARKELKQENSLKNSINSKMDRLAQGENVSFSFDEKKMLGEYENARRRAQNDLDAATLAEMDSSGTDGSASIEAPATRREDVAAELPSIPSPPAETAVQGVQNANDFSAQVALLTESNGIAREILAKIPEVE